MYDRHPLSLFACALFFFFFWPGEVDLETTNFWLGDLLSEQYLNLYRMKGIIAVAGLEERYVFQVQKKNG